MLTQGLSAAEAKVKSGDWRARVLERFAGQHHASPSSPSTEAAEAGLDFEPSAYWFWARVVPHYGRALMVWQLRAEYAQDPRIVVSPFDTGGVWAGHIDASPPFGGPEDRREFVRGMTTTFEAAKSLFFEWVDDAFNSRDEYVNGVGPPTWVLSERLSVSQLDPFSWSWEVRIPKDEKLEEALSLERVFWSKVEFRQMLAYCKRAFPDPLAYKSVAQSLYALGDIQASHAAAMRFARVHIAGCLERS